MPSRKRSRTRSQSRSDNSLIIDKFLSEGMMGKVYLVKDSNGTEYAMKEEFISSKNDRYLKNELNFVKQVASKYPEHFIQLISYKYITNCKASTPNLRDWSTEYEKQWLLRLRSSGLCVQKVYSLIDTSLDKLPIRKMSLNERYSMLIQVLYIKFLFEQHGWVHGDFHFGNIGVKFVSPKKKLNILGYQIPTFGKQYQAIDYGGVLHKRTASSTHLYQQREDVTEKQHFKEHWMVDKEGVIAQMTDETNWWDYIETHQIKMLGYEQDKAKILAQPEAQLLKQITPKDDAVFRLYQLLFTESFQRIILGKDFTRPIDIPCYLPGTDMMFLYHHLDDLETIIVYLASRLNLCKKGCSI